MTDQPSALARWGAFKDLADALARGELRLAARGLWGSSRGLVIAGLARAAERPIFVVAPGHAEVHHTAQDVAYFLDSLAGAGEGARRVLEFPPPQGGGWRGNRHGEQDAMRALVGHRLLRGEPVVVVATPAALTAPLLKPADYRARLLRLELGGTVDREQLLAGLEAAGYERVEAVVEVGQWSLRGGIVDIFSPSHERPVRARVLRRRDRVAAPLRPDHPALGGASATSTSCRSWGPRRARRTSPALAARSPPTCPATRSRAARSRRARGAAGRRPVGGAAGRAARGVPAPGPLAACPRRSRGRQLRHGHALGGRLPRPVQDARAARSRSGGPRASRCAWSSTTRVRARGSARSFRARARGLAGGDALEPGRARRPGGRCLDGLPASRAGARASSREEEIFGAAPAPPAAALPARRRHRLLHRPGGQRPRGARVARRGALSRPQHAHFQGREADFLLLEYGEGGRLYLPVERLDLISKYMGPRTARPSWTGSAAPRGGGSRSRCAPRSAKWRRSCSSSTPPASWRPRPAFGPDAPWQREFEAAFRFEETPDQQKAIDEVKADMERERPMDRLVAGDVGYGKTEVALRAAFKAVTEGRQVAVLVPTTVLAQQHFNTFADRFEPFPAKVELLSRFRTPEGDEGGAGGAQAGGGGRGDRHASAPLQGRGVQAARPPGGGRGAPLRRHPQGAHQADAPCGGRAHPHRDAHSPHALHGHVGGARPLRDRDRSAQPPAGGDGGTAFSRGVIKEAIERELQRGGPGVLRAQPGAVARLHDHASSRAWSRRRAWSWRTARWRSASSRR